MDRNEMEGAVPLSKPMKMVTVRMTDDERDALMRLAEDQQVTMTWVIREGLRLFASDVDESLLRAFDEGDTRHLPA
jgi:predicted transcriptional regulator